MGRVVSWTCGLSSAALFLLAIGLAAHVRLGLGHWPRPMWEEYRTAALDAHWILLMGVGFFAAFAAVPLWISCVAWRRWRSSRRAHFAQAALFALGWGLLGGFMVLDPYQFISWVAD